MEDRDIPYQGQDSGFIWEEENGVIMCDPKYTLIEELKENTTVQTDYSEIC